MYRAINLTKSALLLAMSLSLPQLKGSEKAVETFGKCLEKSLGLKRALLGKAVLLLQLTWECDATEEINAKYDLVRRLTKRLFALIPASQPALESLSA